MCEPPITMCVCEPPIRVGLRAPITGGVHEFSMIAGIAGGSQSRDVSIHIQRCGAAEGEQFRPPLFLSNDGIVVSITFTPHGIMLCSCCVHQEESQGRRSEAEGAVPGRGRPPRGGDGSPASPRHRPGGRTTTRPRRSWGWLSSLSCRRCGCSGSCITRRRRAPRSTLQRRAPRAAPCPQGPEMGRIQRQRQWRSRRRAGAGAPPSGTHSGAEQACRCGAGRRDGVGMGRTRSGGKMSDRPAARQCSCPLSLQAIGQRQDNAPTPCPCR